MADSTPGAMSGTTNANDTSAVSVASTSQSGASPSSSPTRDRASSSVSGNRIRSMSQRIMDANLPRGMWSATGEAASKAPSLADIRRGSYGSNGWDGEGQQRNSTTSVDVMRKRQGSNSGQGPRVVAPPVAPRKEKGPVSRGGIDDIEAEDDGFPAMVFGRGEMSDQSYVRGAPKAKAPQTTPFNHADDDADFDDLADIDPRPKRKSKDVRAMLGESPRTSSSNPTTNEAKPVPNDDGVYPNGYRFPRKKSWGEATVIGLKALWKFTLTPLGFLIVVYGLNVVAWGGMLFLLLCGAAPAMCYPAHLHGIKDCNDIAAPRRIWIETDSQILNALFCVTGFGLIPWRFRDFYYLMKWRVGKKESALRKLAGFHNGWFRLPGSDHLPVTPRHEGAILESEEDLNNAALPLPLTKTPDPPLTGIRAPPTVPWKLDYVIWAFVLNTILQGVLSGFMWGFNRYTRPSWSTGLFVAMACIVAALGGLMQFTEGKRIKKVEGIPVSAEEVLRDVEQGEKEKKDVKGKKEKGNA